MVKQIQISKLYFRKIWSVSNLDFKGIYSNAISVSNIIILLELWRQNHKLKFLVIPQRLVRTYISYLSSNGINNCVIAKWARWLYPQWYSWPSAVLRNGTHWIFALFIKICILCSNSNILVVNWRTLWMLENGENVLLFSCHDLTFPVYLFYQFYMQW